jgi:hypothetical protein
MLGTGAGAEMRRTLGVAVFSGMLGVTLFGIFLTPVFFNVIEWFIDLRLAGSRTNLVGRVLLFPLRMLKVAVVWPLMQLSRALERSRVAAKRRRQTPVANGTAQGDGQGKKRPVEAVPDEHIKAVRLDGGARGAQKNGGNGESTRGGASGVVRSQAEPGNENGNEKDGNGEMDAGLGRGASGAVRSQAEPGNEKA